MTPNLRQLLLPCDLCDAAEQRFAARFSSVEELLTFVLQELLRDEARNMDQSEQQMIEQRLKDLGYV